MLEIRAHTWVVGGVDVHGWVLVGIRWGLCWGYKKKGGWCGGYLGHNHKGCVAWGGHNAETLDITVKSP